MRWPWSRANLCQHRYEHVHFAQAPIEGFGYWTATMYRCKKCGKEHTRWSHVSRASSEAWALMNDVWKGEIPSNSGYRCEMPVYVSMLIRDQGEQVAREYLEGVIERGNCHEMAAFRSSFNSFVHHTE